MTKHLIYTSYKLNNRAGGPSGYLANLKEGLLLLNDTSVEFFCCLADGGKNTNKLKTIIKSIIPQKLLKKIKNRRELSGIDNIFELLTLPPNIEQYSSIHFHTTVELYMFVHKFKQHLGAIKIYLTSHCPQLPYQEHIEKLASTIKNQANLAKECKKYQEIDYQAFTQADAIIFPSQHAMEPYLIDPHLAKILEKKKLKFVFTGCAKLPVIVKRDKFRQALKLIENDFVVTFIGRHNEIKGYDLLQQAALLVWQKNPLIKFVIAGASSNISALSHANWLELGQISNPGDLLSAADLFVLPNRQTYFDLILLECLSVGTNALISETGGNKDLIGLSDGIMKFIPNDAQDLALAILAQVNISKEKRLRQCQHNQLVYEQNFSLLNFAGNYISAIRNLNIELA